MVLEYIVEKGGGRGRRRKEKEKWKKKEEGRGEVVLLLYLLLDKWDLVKCFFLVRDIISIVRIKL